MWIITVPQTTSEMISSTTVVILGSALFVTVISQQVLEKQNGEFVYVPGNKQPYPFYMNDYPFLPPNMDSQLKQADSESFPIMQAPVALSNPIWNLISRAGSMYRLFRRSAGPPPEEFATSP